MSDIIRLKDTDGAVHWTARGSEAAQRLIRDGAVDLDAQEAGGATEPPAQGDDQDTGTAGGGSGQRKRASRTADHSDRGTGEA